MKYKRFYLWGSVSLAIIFTLIAPFIQYYYGYSDVTCGSECWTEFCLKNGGTALYFYNRDELPLTFSPLNSVKKVHFYQKDGRYKSGWREIDFIQPYSKDVKYVFKIAAYAMQCYAINITKDPEATVKWTFGTLDPYFYGISNGTSLFYHAHQNISINISQHYAPNWSRIRSSINYSTGTYSWTLEEYNITTYPWSPWTFNFTNNGTVNYTVQMKLNESKNWINWKCYGKNVSVNWTDMFNLTGNTSLFINCTLDVNLSAGYYNWSKEKPANYTVYFDFENFNGTHTLDRKGRIGNVSGATYTNNDLKFKGLFTFDGINDYISTDLLDEFYADNDGVTISMWFKAYQQPNDFSRLFDALNGSVEEGFFCFIRGTDGQLECRHYCDRNGSYRNLDTLTSFNDSKWHHIAVNISNSTKNIDVYIDTVKYGSLSTYKGCDDFYKTSVPTIKFGQQRNPTGNQFNGSIDDIIIYNRSLSYNDIQQIYHTYDRTDFGFNFTVNTTAYKT